MGKNRKYETYIIENILKDINDLTKELIHILDWNNKKIDSVDIEFWPKYDEQITIRFWNKEKKEYLFNKFTTHWSKINLYIKDIIKYMRSREILFRKFK